MAASRPEAISLVLTLRLTGPPPARLPAWWGRAAQQALLGLVRQQDPALSRELHGGEGRRPYSASSLSSLKPDWPNPPDLAQPCRLRLTAVNPRLAALLLDAAQAGPLRPGMVLELDHLPFNILACDWQADDWAFCGSWEQLWGMVRALDLSGKDSLSLQFNSPTYFKSGGAYERLPLPELVFHQPARLAAAWAGLKLGFDPSEYAAKQMRLAGSFGLRTDEVETRGGVQRAGASGLIEYRFLEPEPETMRAFYKLAYFAFFCGVGMETTVGCGQLRVAG